MNGGGVRGVGQERGYAAIKMDAAFVFLERISCIYVNLDLYRLVDLLMYCPAVPVNLNILLWPHSDSEVQHSINTRYMGHNFKTGKNYVPKRLFSSRLERQSAQ